MKKVLIIDDEAAGIQLIKQYIEEYPDFIVLGEANNGVDAVKLINQFKPDLVFLDVQMPGLTGFEVLTHLDEIPQVVFSTAYDKYAMEAFEVHAVDYLLKPYSKDRFKKAINKVIKTNFSNVKPLTESLFDKTPYPERILVNSAKKLVSINTKDITHIEADRDYSELFCEKGKFLSNYGIGILEQKLDPEVFIRIHRSSIVNISFIKEVEKYGNSYIVTLKNELPIKVSRGYLDNLKKLMF